MTGIPDGLYDLEAWPYLPGTVVTVGADGRAWRRVAGWDTNGQLVPWGAPRPYNRGHLALCRRGGAVPDPAGNPGLVDDCAALLALRWRVTGSGARYSYWNTRQSMREWRGIGLGGTPLRVHELRLESGGLRWPDARALRWLTELRRLELSNFALSSIPRELGQLAQLEELRLADSHLRGRIPAELGELANLRHLDLARNELTRAIPVELGHMMALRHVDLSRNQLTGRIPPELGQLTNLVSLDLSHNQLTGAIPVELSQLAGLRAVRFAGNPLTGCVPVGLPVVDREELGLPDCAAAE